jgi:hypothetical protein
LEIICKTFSFYIDLPYEPIVVELDKYGDLNAQPQLYAITRNSPAIYSIDIEGNATELANLSSFADGIVLDMAFDLAYEKKTDVI